MLADGGGVHDQRGGLGRAATGATSTPSSAAASGRRALTATLQPAPAAPPPRPGPRRPAPSTSASAARHRPERPQEAGAVGGLAAQAAVAHEHRVDRPGPARPRRELAAQVEHGLLVGDRDVHARVAARVAGRRRMRAGRPAARRRRCTPSPGRAPGRRPCASPASASAPPDGRSPRPAPSSAMRQEVRSSSTVKYWAAWPGTGHVVEVVVVRRVGGRLQRGQARGCRSGSAAGPCARGGCTAPGWSGRTRGWSPSTSPGGRGWWRRSRAACPAAAGCRSRPRPWPGRRAPAPRARSSTRSAARRRGQVLRPGVAHVHLREGVAERGQLLRDERRGGLVRAHLVRGREHEPLHVQVVAEARRRHRGAHGGGVGLRADPDVPQQRLDLGQPEPLGDDEPRIPGRRPGVQAGDDRVVSGARPERVRPGLEVRPLATAPSRSR